MQRMYAPITSQSFSQKILGLSETQLALFTENVSEEQRNYLLFLPLTNHPEKDLTLTQVNDFELVFIIAFAQWGPMVDSRFLQSSFADILIKLEPKTEPLAVFLQTALAGRMPPKLQLSTKEQIIYLLSLEQSKRFLEINFKKLFKCNLMSLSNFINSSLLFLLIKECLINKGIVNEALPKRLHLSLYYASHPQNISLYLQQKTTPSSIKDSKKIKKNKKNQSTWKLLLTKQPKLEERILDGKKVLVIDLEDKQQWTLKSKDLKKTIPQQQLPRQNIQQPSPHRHRPLLPKPLQLNPSYNSPPSNRLLTFSQAMQSFFNLFSASTDIFSTPPIPSLSQDLSTPQTSMLDLASPESLNTSGTVQDLELSPEELNELLSCLPPAVTLEENKGEESNDTPSYTPTL